MVSGEEQKLDMGENYNEYSHRPWGYYEVLSDGPTHKVKRIVVNSGKRLSYQYHSKRSEHWFVVSGYGIVTLNDEKIEVGPGSSVDIPVNMKHRIKCISEEPIVFIEIQTGTYFGEDDIVRIEDDFGRDR